jgi:hypothetical protein
MKKFFFLTAVVLSITFSSCQQNKKPSTEQSDVVGVYQYTGNLEGMSIWTDKYFVAAAKNKNEPSEVDSTDFYKHAYQSLVMEAGTWTQEDSIVTCTYLFAKNPSLVGKTFRFTYNSEGDNFSYHVLNENNERIGGGSTIRLKQSNTPNDLIGVYQYTGEEEGICAMTEDYFIFTGRNKNRFSMVDSTDAYINKYKSILLQAGTYTMQDSIVTSKLLFDKNPSYQGTSYRWAYSFKVKEDRLAAGFVNENGEVRGWSDYLIKME